MSVLVYRENLREAQRQLEVATRVFEGFKDQGLILWATTKRGYEGWCVKGEKADQAFAGYVKAKADVEFWGERLNETLRLRPVPQDSRLPPERDEDELTPEEVARRKADLNAQFEAWQTRNALPESP